MSNKTKAIFIIVLGVILVGVGVFASMMLVQRLQANQPQAAVEEDTVKTTVVVLTRDLALGDVIAAGDVEFASVPVEDSF